MSLTWMSRAVNALRRKLSRTAAVRSHLVRDVADESAAGDAVRQTAAELGPVNVLVNSAGIIRDNLIFRMSTG